MSKKIIFDKSARKKLQKGVDIVANAVKVTMGHKGRAVLIPKGHPTFTLDGVTVAETIDKLTDKVEDMGAQLVKNVARNTNDEAGDGTTTATLLTQQLLYEGLKGIEQGIDPIKIRDSYHLAMDVVMRNIKENSKPVKDEKDMASIATISSRNQGMGELIGKIYNKIGRDGIITTEEMKQVGMDYEMVEGLQIDSGFVSPYFITNMERKVAEIEKPLILVTSQSIRSNEQIVPLLNEVLDNSDKKSLVVISDEFQGEALATMVINKMQGVARTLVIKTPGMGDNKVEYLKDICAITGADFISEEAGKRVEDVTLDQLGRADRIVSYKNRTIIVGGKGNKKDIKARIDEIKHDLAETSSKYKKETYNQRLARLKGGVAVIKVGSYNAEAAKEEQYRLEDAINATKSALEEGVVLGGGMALYNASMELNKLIEVEKDQDVRFGLQAVRNAIQTPAYQILRNEGREPAVVLAQGYKLGKEVIDPLKVERIALEQAISQVGLLLITQAVVYEHDEKANVKKENQED